MLLSALCFFGVKEHVGENDSGELNIKKVPFKEAFPAMVRKWGKQKILILGSLLMIAGSVVIGLAGSAFTLAMFGVCVRACGGKLDYRFRGL